MVHSVGFSHQVLVVGGFLVTQRVNTVSDSKIIFIGFFYRVRYCTWFQLALYFHVIDASIGLVFASSFLISFSV